LHGRLCICIKGSVFVWDVLCLHGGLCFHERFYVCKEGSVM
jgi:hypothetical protein